MLLPRTLKEFLKLCLFRLFKIGQAFGVDILPRHFYSEIPCLKTLETTSSWRMPYSMIGIAGTDLDSQLHFVEQLFAKDIVDEIKSRNIHSDATAANGEGGFGPVEADVLFAYIASVKPKQIFKIGCGVSTAVCLMAAEFIGYRPEIICLEPFPNEFLKTKAQEKSIELMEIGAQDYEPCEIEELGSNLLFFVDSTHTLGPAGEVSRIVLEMVPRLKNNAMVHFHDIVFPYDYSRTILTKDNFFHHESILLQAFLAFNSRFQIDASLSMLHYQEPLRLGGVLPRYMPATNKDGLQLEPGDFPSSIYFHAAN